MQFFTDASQSITSHSSNFTSSNPVIPSITFNGITSAEAITKLAKFIKRQWYVGNDKKVYMRDANALTNIFVKEPDESNDFQYIYRSLHAKTDLSQVRNYVEVRGASERGEGECNTKCYCKW